MDSLHLGRWMAETDRRMQSLEDWRHSINATAKALLRRVSIAVTVVSLSILINLYPNTEVAKYADSFRHALMRR